MKTQTYDDSALTQPGDLSAIRWDRLPGNSPFPAGPYRAASESDSDTGFPDTVASDEFADTIPNWRES